MSRGHGTKTDIVKLAKWGPEETRPHRGSSRWRFGWKLPRQWPSFNLLRNGAICARDRGDSETSKKRKRFLECLVDHYQRICEKRDHT